jgi:hypothetical protein
VQKILTGTSPDDLKPIEIKTNRRTRSTANAVKEGGAQ